MNQVIRSEPKETPPTKQEMLLTEIRDLLRAGQQR
jgi:large-conductance mechanosensitive channel